MICDNSNTDDGIDSGDETGWELGAVHGMWGSVWGPECDVPVPGIFHFFGGIRIGIATNWYR